MKGLIVLGLIFIIACSNVENENDKIDIDSECSSDNNCATGGCSGEICGVKGEIENILTTCVFKEEYECYRLTNCGCVNRKCQWERNKKFNECLNKFNED